MADKIIKESNITPKLKAVEQIPGVNKAQLDAETALRNLNIPEPVDPVFEYAICPASATCVLPLSAHIIPLNFGTTETNDSGMIVTANKITITKAGTYMVTGSIVYNGLVNDGTWRTCQLRKNSSAIAEDEINPRTGWTYTNATCLTKCNIGDTIDMVGLNNASSCVDIRDSAHQSYLHVARVA